MTKRFDRRAFLVGGARLGSGMVFSALALGFAQESHARKVFYGNRIAHKDDDQGRHWYVRFTVNMCANNWWVEGPVWCHLWPTAKPICGQPWVIQPDKDGHLYAGFRWFDQVDPTAVLQPSSFRLYPSR